MRSFYTGLVGSSPLARSMPRNFAQSGMRSNLSDIDIFRGIAALIVAAMHTREITWVGMREFWHLHGLQSAPNVILGYVTFPMVWGSIGVPIFFVLSGYCIHRSQAFTRMRDGSFQLSPTNFLMRRFFRIYPVLFGALLGTLLCDWLSRHYFPISYKLGDTGIGTFLVTLLSLQGIASREYGSNGPLWTLSIEVQFYVLYPLLLVSMFRLGKLTTFGVLAVVNVVSYCALERYGYQLFSSYYVSWYLGALVAEGEAMGLLSERLSSSRLRAAFYALGFVFLCAGCALFFLSSYVAFQVWAVAFAIFLFAVLKRPTELSGWAARAFRWLGTFSFSLYIIHLPVVVLIHSVVFNSVHQVSIAPFCATLVAAIGCAYAFSFIFERPALALSQMWKGKRHLVRAGPE
jgi:peptidoglycan/LPS O-acetylase OafA/YrhL